MATVQFILRDPSAKKKTSIYAVFYYDQEMIKISTGKNIDPGEWDKSTRLAKETQRYKVNEKLNSDLREIRDNLISAFDNHMKRNKAVFVNELQAEFKNVIHPPAEIKPDRITLFKCIKEYINTCNKATRTKLGYGTTYNTLKRYSGAMLKNELDFDNIGRDFYNDFQRYCFEVENLAINTFGGYVKNIKVFMDYANYKGYTTNTGHRDKEFKKTQETSDTIFLNDSELETIYNLDLSENPRLDRVRDLFIIGCHTGLRYSDLSQLNERNITGGGTKLTVRTVKTGEKVVIPLHRQVRAILKKRDGAPPNSISNQKMNDYLKELGQKAELNETVSRSITRGGLKVETSLKKWELITVHTARRSFATNMYLADVPSISIMKITGHRTERSFLKYVKITADQNADKLSTHPRFAQSQLKVVAG